MNSKILILAIFLPVLSCGLAASEKKPDALELARLAVNLELKHGALDVALDEGADIAFTGSIDVLEYNLGKVLSNEERDKVRVIFREALESILTPEVWVDASAEVYSRHLTQQELSDLAAFYRTESGARILAVQGSLTRDLGDSAEKILEANHEAFSGQVDSALAELFPDYELGEIQ